MCNISLYNCSELQYPAICLCPVAMSCWSVLCYDDLYSVQCPSSGVCYDDPFVCSSVLVVECVMMTCSL